MLKLTRRAAGLFPFASLPQAPVTLQLVAAYAAQNPGLDAGNYFRGWQDKSGRAAYMSESRAITKDLQRVRDAVRECVYMRVTDSDIIDASRQAYSGRLSIVTDDDGNNMRLDYCTGQYWPTEYRKACASVLEAAIRIASARNA